MVSTNNRWPILKLYCNWALHKDLGNRNCKARKTLFETVALSLNQHWGESEVICSEVTKGIGIFKLKEELTEFLSYILPQGVRLSTGSFPLSFYETLLYIIGNREISNVAERGKISEYGRVNISREDEQEVFVSKVEVVKEPCGNAFLEIYLDPPPLKSINGKILSARLTSEV